VALAVVVWGCLPSGPSGPLPPAEPADVRDPEIDRDTALPDSGAILAEVREIARSGDEARALTTLLLADPERIPATPDTRALARSLTRTLSGDALARVLQAVPPGAPLAVPAQLAYARVLNLAGRPDESRAFAEAALDAGAQGQELEVARALLEGRPLPGGGRARLGALLPLSGSPGLQRFAREVRAGIETAVTASGLDPEDVELRVLDTGGDPSAAANLLRTLEGEGVMGVVGPLESPSLAAAVEGRHGVLPLISPTVWEVPPASSRVYSLGNDDRRGPVVLAEWALSAGITQVVVLSPTRGPGSGEVGIFRERFEAGGGSILRVFTYEPGTTFFGEQMRAIRGLKPEALVLPVPPEDVQAVAGQAAYFALDTLGVQLLGTGGWTGDQVMGSVGERSLEGVAVATPVRPGPDAPGYRRFVEAYERRFRRTLVDPAVPALGYDAALLVLRALEMGARDPDAVGRALEEIRELPGATGVLSVEAGRLVRAHEMVCIAGGRLLPLAKGARPVPVYRPYEPDPETGEVPEGPGHPDGFVCPQLAPDSLPARPDSAGPPPGGTASPRADRRGFSKFPAPA
jgi:branched-chain amino acid transport system substrate-binding protein